MTGQDVLKDLLPSREGGSSNWTKPKQTNWDSSINQFHLFRGQGKASCGNWYLVISVSASYWYFWVLSLLAPRKILCFCPLDVRQGLGLVTILLMGCECKWHVSFLGQSNHWLVGNPALPFPCNSDCGGPSWYGGAVLGQPKEESWPKRWARPAKDCVKEKQTPVVLSYRDRDFVTAAWLSLSWLIHKLTESRRLAIGMRMWERCCK